MAQITVHSVAFVLMVFFGGGAQETLSAMHVLQVESSLCSLMVPLRREGLQGKTT